MLEARGSLDWVRVQLGLNAISVSRDMCGTWLQGAANDEAWRREKALPG